MSVLIDRDIQELVNSSQLITDFEARSLEGASYDMRLGPQYIKGGEIETLTESKPSLKLLPGEFAVLRTLEELNMPANLVGHNGIMSPWAKRGLVSLFSPQIDPGFCGFLIVPVFNAGDGPIALTYKESLFTVEFVRTTAEASYKWSEKHGRQDRLFVPATPSHLRPNLLDIQVFQEGLKTTTAKVTELESQLRSIATEHKIIQTRLGLSREQTALRYNRWRLIIALGLLLATFFSGVLGRDFLQRKGNELLPNLIPPVAQPENK